MKSLIMGNQRQRRRIAAVAVEQGLCRAAHDIDCKTPTLAEMKFDERPGEALLLLVAERTDPKEFVRRVPASSASSLRAVASGSVTLVRTSVDSLPASKVLSVFADGHTRAMPVPMNTPGTTNSFPMVSCAALAVRGTAYGTRRLLCNPVLECSARAGDTQHVEAP